MEYTILDDFHFKKAGLRDDQLDGYYLTEDDGRLLRVFPGSERLRYLLPFRPPHETIDFLRSVAERRPGAVMVFGDDGEKFGTWPGTKEHVYDRGWLNDFFGALEANSDWLMTTTPSEAIESVPPLGKLYIPEASYREMTEWALPAARISEYEDIQHWLEDQGSWDRVQPFMRGGYWRNFKVKYPETNAMYCRMQMVSKRVNEAAAAGVPADVVEQARLDLYRGQCNCSYWHGAFGGIYLPHLRNAVFEHLIAAENLLDEAEGRGRTGSGTQWVELTSEDYNLDGRPEARLANNRLSVLVSPAEGGQIYELDVRAIRHNLAATLGRRPEAYHRKVLGGENAGGGDVASIHDRVVFKQEGLDQRVQYDHWERNSLVDHFYREGVPCGDVVSGSAEELGDFITGAFEARLRRSEGRVQLQMTRTGLVMGEQVTMTKGVSLNADSNQLEIAYLLEGLTGDQRFQFAPELNIAGLPSGTDDRYFRTGAGERLGGARRTARPGRHYRAGAGRRVARHRRGRRLRPADGGVDVPGGDGQPVGGRVRAGAPIGGGGAALDGGSGRGGPVERHGAPHDRHAAGRATGGADADCSDGLGFCLGEERFGLARPGGFRGGLPIDQRVERRASMGDRTEQ